MLTPTFVFALNLARKQEDIDTLGSTYNEFGYNEHSAEMSRFLCNNVIDWNVKKFVYNEQFLFHLLVVSWIQCNSSQFRFCSAENAIAINLAHDSDIHIMYPNCKVLCSSVQLLACLCGYLPKS